MSDLLPCPFCGGEAAHGEIADDCMPPHPDQGGHFIQCANNACGASTNLRFACGDDPKPLLAEQWNRRAAAEIAELRAALAALSHAFDHMLFNVPREREYDAQREADRLLSLIQPPSMFAVSEELRTDDEAAP
jgi:hypothetical protein